LFKIFKKKSAKITSVKLKKKSKQKHPSSKQLLYLRKKVFVIQQKIMSLTYNSLPKKIFAKRTKIHHQNLNISTRNLRKMPMTS